MGRVNPPVPLIEVIRIHGVRHVVVAERRNLATPAAGSISKQAFLQAAEVAKAIIVVAFIAVVVETPLPVQRAEMAGPPSPASAVKTPTAVAAVAVPAVPVPAVAGRASPGGTTVADRAIAGRFNAGTTLPGPPLIGNQLDSLGFMVCRDVFGQLNACILVFDFL